MQFCNPGVACKVQIVSGPNFQSDCELHVLSEERSHTSVWHGGLKPTVGHFFLIGISIGICYRWKQDVSVLVDYRYLSPKIIGISIGKIKIIGIGDRLSVSSRLNFVKMNNIVHVNYVKSLIDFINVVN